MGEVLHAIGVFFEQLASVKFSALALAIVAATCSRRCARAARGGTRSPPRTRRKRSAGAPIYAAYLAGVGRQRDHPGARRRRRAALPRPPRCARQHLHDARLDAARPLLLRHGDGAADLRLRADARRPPGVGSLGELPGFDFGFFASNPECSFVLLVALVIFGVIGVFWVRLHVAEFKAARPPGVRRAARPTRYLRASRSGRRATGCSASSRSGSSSTRSGSSRRSGTSCSSR